MTQFAKDVAKHLDRRQRRRRLLFLTAALVAIALAALYLRCGTGWGLGGTGDGAGSSMRAGDAGALRCAIRVAAHRITVDGVPMTRAKAVAACKSTTGADVVVTGEARQGDWDELRAALEAARVPVYLRER